MKKQSIDSSFAQKYWKSFEKLVIELLKRKLGNNNAYQVYAHKTPDQNDGGYDGIIFIEPLIDFSEELKTLYTILIEAKLRQNTSKDLPLSDFAKTLIIAVNRSAAEIYVYTNLHYSPETYQRVQQFSASTSLSVKLIDIFELCNELNNFSEIQKDFPTEFIQQLFDALKLHKKEKKITYVQENIFENILPKLTGDYRNNLLEESIEYFAKYSGVFIVKGIQGCGKKLFIKHILNSLQFTFNCRLISLEKFTTIKGFFVYLLSLIWNVDSVDIYNLTGDNIDEIMSYMPAQYRPERVKRILLNILKDIPDEYEDRRDVLEEHLIEYLYYIFTPICNRKKQLFAFINLDKCADNILNFTNKFIRKFSSQNIIILSELRIDDPRTCVYINEWSKLNPNIKQMELNEFNYLEYIQYMHDNYSDKNMELVDKLYKICYPLPIYIDNLISIMDNNNLEKLLSQDSLNIQKLYNNDKFKSKLILQSISSYFIDKTILFKELAYAIVFFNGELSFNNISKLGGAYFDTALLLGESIYFDIEKKHLHIHHILYLKAFQNDTILEYYEYNSIMETLYNVIDDFEMDSNIKKVKKLEIAVALKKKEYVLNNWEKICSSLIAQNDFSYAKQLLKNIFQEDQLCNAQKLNLVNCIIKCFLGLNEYKAKDLLSYIAIGESLQEKAHILDRRLFCYLKAKYKLALGEYQEIITLTKQYKNEDPDIRFIRALGVKHIYGIDACLLSLKRGKKHFHEDWHLCYSYLDHLHSKYEKINYKKSWDFLVQIEQYYDKLNLEEQIHFDYNKIALKLYRNESASIDDCKKLFCKTYENILPIEMGRTHNLLGQIYYLNNDIISAIEEFRLSWNVFKENIHATYIFVPLVNLAIIYDVVNEDSLCIQYITNALKYLEKYKIDKIKKQLKKFNSNIIIEKECAAFILLMELLQKRTPEICKQFQVKFREYDSQTHSSSKLPQYYRLSNKFTFRC